VLLASGISPSRRSVLSDRPRLAVVSALRAPIASLPRGSIFLS
jgi:hypothetical protein